MKRFNRYSVLFFILLLAAALPVTASANTNVSGIISTDTTWTLAGSPYIVTGSVLVSSGVTLTIEPGVIVRFDSNTGIQVDGALIAAGTDTDNIVFTSNQTAPSPGNWGYIFFTDTSTDATYDAGENYTGGSILEYCVIEYAGSASVTNNGALRMGNAHPFINYCTIRDNAAAGINAYNVTGTLKIANSSISNNAGSGVKAGIKAYNVTGYIRITDSSISNNAGSGIGISGGSAIPTNNTIISNNTISANTGDGISVADYVVVTISNNTISNNKKGIEIYDSEGTISNNTISNNSGSDVGGGISAAYGSSLSGWGSVTISDNFISGNSAASSGGGIRAGLPGTIYNNTIINNSASSGGGGIYGGAATVSNNIISNNTTSGKGGGIYGVATISNNIISNNTASVSGGGIYSGGTIINNTITGNSGGNASAVHYSSKVADLDFKNNTITGNTATGAAPTYTVSINGNPLINYNDIFDNTATYELWNKNAAGSPSVDATYNWWGTAVDSEIQTKIYDWSDDISKGIVDYAPYWTAPGGLVYFDDFNDGNDNGWTVKSGTWQVVGGEYRETGSAAEATAISLINNTTQDMTIGVKGKDTDTGAWRNFFIVFAYDEANGKAYWAGARISNNPPGSWSIEEVDLLTGARIQLAKQSEYLNVNTWYNLKVVINGDTVTLYADGAEKTSYTFPGGMPAGRIGLGGQNNQALFDDFVIDTDGDGIADDGDGSGILGDNRCTAGNTANCDDNCRLTANSGQQDTDADGYGNMCDADLDNDGFVGPFDFNIFKAAWGSTSSSANWNADADFDSDSFVGPFDFNVFKVRWGTTAPWE